MSAVLTLILALTGWITAMVAIGVARQARRAHPCDESRPEPVEQRRPAALAATEGERVAMAIVTADWSSARWVSPAFGAVAGLDGAVFAERPTALCDLVPGTDHHRLDVVAGDRAATTTLRLRNLADGDTRTLLCVVDPVPDDPEGAFALFLIAVDELAPTDEQLDTVLRGLRSLQERPALESAVPEPAPATTVAAPESAPHRRPARPAPKTPIPVRRKLLNARPEVVAPGSRAR